MNVRDDALRLIRVTKLFGANCGVNKLSLNIPKGVFYAFLGENGAGKTTTLRIISGLIKPDEGEVNILGFDILSEPELAKQKLAFLPDEPLMYDMLKPLEYIEYVAGLWGLSGKTIYSDAIELLEHLSLTSHVGKYIRDLSHGMKQKLALIGALIHKPELIILDEPFTALDVSSARLVKALLKKFVSEGNTVILTTHVLEVAEKLADKIGIISNGRLIEEGTLEELKLKAGTESSLEEIFLRLTKYENI